MPAAEKAVQDAATKIPAEVSARFASADKLSDEDRKAITDIARQALAPFQAKPAPDDKSGSNDAAKTTAKAP
jgi:F-type H+-transporting ATPase subunit alpha